MDDLNTTALKALKQFALKAPECTVTLISKEERAAVICVFVGFRKTTNVIWKKQAYATILAQGLSMLSSFYMQSHHQSGL